LPTPEPSEWILRWCARLPAQSRVLDVACGSGRHARALAAAGCRVDAVDKDPGHAAGLAGVAGVRFIALDLEDGPWPFEPAQYDAVVVANYLHRPRLGLLAQALRDGGILVYETFAVGNERFGRPTNPDYLLRPFELAAYFSPLLHVLAFEDGVVGQPAPARVQRLCAVRAGPEPVDRLMLAQPRRPHV
jgi:SAM-dependent methyltransferase